MSLKNLIIYNLEQFYNILNEVRHELNFKIIYVNEKNFLKDEIKYINNYLIISDKKYPNIDNQFVLDNLPINIFKFNEKINTEFLKLQFNNQSKIKVS